MAPDFMSAEVAELVDAQASGVCGPCGLGGSSPPFRTISLTRNTDICPPKQKPCKNLEEF